MVTIVRSDRRLAMINYVNRMEDWQKQAIQYGNCNRLRFVLEGRSASNMLAKQNELPNLISRLKGRALIIKVQSLKFNQPPEAVNLLFRPKSDCALCAFARFFGIATVTVEQGSPKQLLLISVQAFERWLNFQFSNLETTLTLLFFGLCSFQPGKR